MMHYLTVKDDITTPKWGLLGTIIGGGLIALGFVITQTIVLGIYVASVYGDATGPELEALIGSLEVNGTFLYISTFSTTLICSSLIFVIIKLKKGTRLRDYLGLKTVDRKTCIFWFSIVVMFLILVDTLSIVLGRDIIPEFMVSAYSSADNIWLFCLAIILAAPFLEEIFFRGFLITGMSSIGVYGSIVATSLVWASIHTQYGLYEIIIIFLLGLILGAARLFTGSVYLTYGLHSITNLIATVETMLYISR